MTNTCEILKDLDATDTLLSFNTIEEVREYMEKDDTVGDAVVPSNFQTLFENDVQFANIGIDMPDAMLAYLLLNLQFMNTENHQCEITNQEPVVEENQHTEQQCKIYIQTNQDQLDQEQLDQDQTDIGEMETAPEQLPWLYEFDEHSIDINYIKDFVKSVEPEQLSEVVEIKPVIEQAEQFFDPEQLSEIDEQEQLSEVFEQEQLSEVVEQELYANVLIQPVPEQMDQVAEMTIASGVENVHDPSISNSNKRQRTEATQPLYGTHDSVPYVVNKLLFSRRGSIEKTIRALEEGIDSVYTEFIDRGKYKTYMYVGDSCTQLGDSDDEKFYTHAVVKETLKKSNITLEKVKKLTELNELMKDKTVLIYGSLNTSFNSKKDPHINNENLKHHVILVKRGLLHCVHLKTKEGVSQTLFATKYLKIVNNNWNKQAAENSYLDIVKGAYIVN
jgi:hypothetical protein